MEIAHGNWKWKLKTEIGNGDWKWRSDMELSLDIEIGN